MAAKSFSMSRRRRSVVVSTDLDMPPRIRPPSHRHSNPSSPWPWIDLDTNLDTSAPEPSESSSECTHEDAACGGPKCWPKYPRSLFPNWTPNQVRRSGIKEFCAGSHTCGIYHVDVGYDGRFSEPETHVVSDENKEIFWKVMQEGRPRNIRVRALFIENLSMPVLQMLGTKYNVEPFFFSSSLNWIPSRYQEAVRLGQGDHITLTLPFIRPMKVPVTTPSSPSAQSSTSTMRSSNVLVDQLIDTQLPLSLHSDDLTRKDDQVLLLDLLAVHMIRSSDSSTIISYHPGEDRRTTSAKSLRSRVSLAGQSVYWQKIFQQSDDPTFVLLAILWYALYAWDEALEILWEHICQLELSVISTNDMLFTLELHKIRAHLLQYASLLEDFHKTVVFVRDTPNPAMDSSSHDDLERRTSKDLLGKECNNLLVEIERLTMSREMQDQRLKNVMNLAFSSVNIEDSKHMQKLTEAAARDSAAMKQISYLTMVFLPASFAASIFGMNIHEINPGTLGSLPHYFETAIPLTAVTIWIIIAYQGKWHIRDGQHQRSMWKRLWWPVLWVTRLIEGRNNVGRRESIHVIV